MKKLSLIVAGLSVLAGVAVQADNTNVTSVNIVGYIQANLPSNQLSFLSVNMNAVGGSNQMFTSVIGDQLPTLSTVYFWNVTSQKWDIAQKVAAAKGGWGIYTNRVMGIGEGLFVKSTSNVTVNLLGEVPLAPTTTVAIFPQYNAYGYAYPVDTAWTSTAVSAVLPTLSYLTVWNQGSQAWVRYQKVAAAKGGWGTATNLVLQSGQGFFVQNAQGYTNAIEARPFNP